VKDLLIDGESASDFMDRVCMDSSLRVVERLLDSEDRLKWRYQEAGIVVTKEGLVYEEGRK
jgi:hypothetical protein